MWIVGTIVAGGLLWCSPQSSTWRPMATHARRSRSSPLGDESREDVAEANFTALMLCLAEVSCAS
jgi:hypothetical protein